VTLGPLLDVRQHPSAARREANHRLPAVALPCPALDPPAPHQHVHRLRDRRQADGLMPRQIAHAARARADAHQAAHLRRRQRPPRTAHLGAERLHHEHHDVQQFAGSRLRLCRGHLRVNKPRLIASAIAL
jgi:hypothetical protein